MPGPARFTTMKRASSPGSEVGGQRFPEQRVVGAEAMQTGRHLADDFVAEQQRRQRFPVDRHHNLTVPHVARVFRDTVRRAGAVSTW